jgi:hypothetical protein
MCVTNTRVLWTKVYDLVPSIPLGFTPNRGNSEFYFRIMNDILSQPMRFPKDSSSSEANVSALQEVVHDGHREQYVTAGTIPDVSDIATSIITSYIAFCQ